MRVTLTCPRHGQWAVPTHTMQPHVCTMHATSRVDWHGTCTRRAWRGSVAAESTGATPGSTQPSHEPPAHTRNGAASAQPRRAPYIPFPAPPQYQTSAVTSHPAGPAPDHGGGRPKSSSIHDSSSSKGSRSHDSWTTSGTAPSKNSADTSAHEAPPRASASAKGSSTGASTGNNAHDNTNSGSNGSSTPVSPSSTELYGSSITIINSPGKGDNRGGSNSVAGAARADAATATAMLTPRKKSTPQFLVFPSREEADALQPPAPKADNPLHPAAQDATPAPPPLPAPTASERAPAGAKATKDKPRKGMGAGPSTRLPDVVFTAEQLQASVMPAALAQPPMVMVQPPESLNAQAEAQVQAPVQAQGQTDTQVLTQALTETQVMTQMQAPVQAQVQTETQMVTQVQAQIVVQAQPQVQVQAQPVKRFTVDDELAVCGLAPCRTDSEDLVYMRLALEQAAEAAAAGEVPVGAVLVSAKGEVLAAAHNQTHNMHNPVAHAELLCIMDAARKKEAWRLLESTLYVTVEPCPMCAGAILQARVGRVVYGAKQPRLGADGSWVSLLRPVGVPDLAPPRAGDATGHRQQAAGPTGPGSSATLSAVPPVAPVGAHPFHSTLKVSSGVMEEECAAAMRTFFRRRRLDTKAGAPTTPAVKPGTKGAAITRSSAQGVLATTAAADAPKAGADKGSSNGSGQQRAPV